MLQPHPAADAVRTPATSSHFASMPAPLCPSIPANGRPPIKCIYPSNAGDTSDQDASNCTVFDDACTEHRGSEHADLRHLLNGVPTRYCADQLEVASVAG
jgi:hypothetical protein